MQGQEISQNHVMAGAQVCDMLAKELTTPEGIHLETMVYAAAVLAGTSMIRTFDLQWTGLTPGTVCLSERADEEWNRLYAFVVHNLQVRGIDVTPKNIVVQTPKENEPRMTVSAIQEKWQEPFNQIMAKHGLNYAKGAQAGAVGVAMIVERNQQHLDPRIACGIAALGFVAGTKTAPPPLPRGGSGGQKEKGTWLKRWFER